MNVQADYGDRVEDPEGPREGGRKQWHVCSAIMVRAARIRTHKVMTRIGSIPHGGQTITRPSRKE
jgi:hypothetical protein